MVLCLLFLWLPYVTSTFSQNETEVLLNIQSGNRLGNWTAGVEWMQRRTEQDIRDLFSVKVKKEREIFRRGWGQLASIVKVPESFDLRNLYPNCLSPISERLSCETAWEIVAIEVLSDRLCIYSSGNFSDRFSLSYLMACNPMSRNCSQGDFPNTWLYIEENGLPLESCVPWVSYKSSCPFACSDFTPMRKFKIRDTLYETSATNIQLSLLNSGPVGGFIEVYEDFLYYQSGVYRHTWGSLIGESMVRVIGWGVEGGIRYWICANNWGREWGENGYVRIEIGELGTEKSAVSIMPTLV